MPGCRCCWAVVPLQCRRSERGLRRSKNRPLERQAAAVAAAGRRRSKWWLSQQRPPVAPAAAPLASRGGSLLAGCWEKEQWWSATHGAWRWLWELLLDDHSVESVCGLLQSVFFPGLRRARIGPALPHAADRIRILLCVAICLPKELGTPRRAPRQPVRPSKSLQGLPMAHPGRRFDDAPPASTVFGAGPGKGLPAESGVPPLLCRFPAAAAAA